MCYPWAVIEIHTQYSDWKHVTTTIMATTNIIFIVIIIINLIITITILTILRATMPNSVCVKSISGKYQGVWILGCKMCGK